MIYKKLKICVFGTNMLAYELVKFLKIEEYKLLSKKLNINKKIICD